MYIVRLMYMVRAILSIVTQSLVLNSSPLVLDLTRLVIAYASKTVRIAQTVAVNWSGKVANSLFIQNCYDMYECMFCSHLAGKRYCVANMQLSEEDYFRVKKIVIGWLIKS